VPYRRQFFGDFQRSQKDHPEWPVVVSEGDSWFSYADVIGQLDDPGDLGGGNQRDWSLLRLEKNGDEVLAMLSGGQRALLRKRVISRFELDALLFSGGGNDIIGPDLPPLLRSYVNGMEAPDLVAFSRFERRLRQIQDCYRELLDLLSDAKQRTKVFVNSYDYSVPSDRPVKLLGIRLTGPWLLPALRHRGIPEPLRSPVVKLLIDSFAAAIDAVAAEPRGAGRLIRVETRQVIGNEWKDEIHPNREGAIRVAQQFERALRTEAVI